MKHFHLTLDEELYKLLRLIAFQTNRSMNDIARKAIKKYLEELLEKKGMNYGRKNENTTYRSLKSGRNPKILISSEHERSLEH